MEADYDDDDDDDDGDFLNIHIYRRFSFVKLTSVFSRAENDNTNAVPEVRSSPLSHCFCSGAQVSLPFFNFPRSI